jgi:DNA helicase-2/ATP-dependent DNA helicase PcrA
MGCSILKQAMIQPDERNDAEWSDMFDYYDIWDELDPDSTQSEGLDQVEELLRVSNDESSRLIDFDDMIYMPLIKSAPFSQYDWVLIDEAQDSNRVRREMASRMLRPGGSLVAVGDRHQAIYGFTGADNDALDILRREFGCKELPLTTTYRCPKAQQYVSHIQAADSAAEGLVKSQTLAEFWQRSASLDKSDAILCRNTKPLIDLAFELIRRNIGCHVEGREIGESLVRLVEKFKSATNLRELRNQLEEYMEVEVSRLEAKGQMGKAAGISDRVETLLVVIDNLDPQETPLSVKLKLSLLFGDTTPGQPSPSLTLCTIHKAKGREWDRVFLWGRNLYQPSRFATQDWQKQQETNLIYVAITRAKETLVEVIL